MRTFNSDLVTEAVSQYAERIEGFYPVEWLSNLNNVALTNKNKDIALFERVAAAPSAVYGHYFFWSRGKDAVKASEEFLKEIFRGDYGVEIIVGLTPTTHKGALWLNQRLGFKKIEVVPSIVGDLQMVMLTKKEWEQQ
jgi:hypothetical protein